jgi:myo-inositol-1(or 4)-monophosphatase
VQRELEVAAEAARHAGAAIRRIFDQQVRTFVEKSDGRGPLTEADLASNAILIEHLRSAFPNDAILSEESADDASRLAAERVWIIDPLDGTREFTLGLPEFVVSVGLAIRGEARVGVLYNPIHDELFAGAVGFGATCNGEPMRVSQSAQIAGARFLVSRNEMEKGWFDEWKDQAHLEPLGSVAYKFALVAAGKAEATFTPKPRNEWDICGGVACLIAAGGHATDGAGKPYRFNQPDPLHVGVCGSNGFVHGAILELLKGK